MSIWEQMLKSVSNKEGKNFKGQERNGSFVYCQIRNYLKEISTQEQKIDSPSVEGDPIDVDTQTVNSPFQQTIDGKKIIYLFYPSTTNMN